MVKLKKMGFSLPFSASAQDLSAIDSERKEEGDEIRCREEAFHDDYGKKYESKGFRTKSSRIKYLSGWKKLSKLWKTSSSLKVPSALLPKLSSIRRKGRSARENYCYDSDRCFINQTMSFTFRQLQSATNNFSKENLIGRGGYADVYKGCLPNGQLVAIKQLKRGMGDEELLNFLSEIGVIAHINHPNTAKLIGYGVDGGAFIVLKLSSLGSLGSLLQGSREKLEWAKRYKIILGIAEGLIYLHEDCERRIIHRDIKADNILLSEDFEPQICDFGLSKWLPTKLSHHHSLKFEGTFGYLAPEYFMHGIVDEKTDVFSFGVLLLELVTGRLALDGSGKSLLLWAKPLLDGNQVKQLVDPSLGNNYKGVEMNWVVSTASMCIDQNPILRPRMRQVATLLRGSDQVTDNNSREVRRRRLHQRTFSEELSHAMEYNSTKRLIDFNKKTTSRNLL